MKKAAARIALPSCSRPPGPAPFALSGSSCRVLGLPVCSGRPFAWQKSMPPLPGGSVVSHCLTQREHIAHGRKAFRLSESFYLKRLPGGRSRRGRGGGSSHTESIYMQRPPFGRRRCFQGCSGIVIFQVSVASIKLSVPLEVAKNRQIGLPSSNRTNGRSRLPIRRVTPSSHSTWRE